MIITQLLIISLILFAALAFTVVLWIIQRKKYKAIISRQHVLEAKVDALRELNNELKAANNLRSRIMSVISHDLRGPMHSLQTLIMLYKQNGITGKELTEYVLKLEEELSQSLSFTNDLLQWAKGQFKDLQMKKSEIKLASLAEDAIRFCKQTACEKGIDIVFNNQIHTGKIIADGDILGSVMRNLLSNAIKFSRSGSAVEINLEEDADHVIFEVKDKGVGMSAQQVRAFYDEKLTSTPGTADEKGMGMGLILAKNFIEMHYGRIILMSSENLGTSFKVLLPKA